MFCSQMLLVYEIYKEAYLQHIFWEVLGPEGKFRKRSYVLYRERERMQEGEDERD